MNLTPETLARSDGSGIRLNGIGIGRRMELGVVYRLERGDLDVPERTISARMIDFEIARFEQAIRQVKGQLAAAKQMVSNLGSRDPTILIEAHELLLQDQTLLDGVVRRIRERTINAEWAVKQQIGEICDLFRNLPDPYIKERAVDVLQVGQRVMRALLGSEDGDGWRSIPEGSVVVAEDITPVDTSHLSHRKIKAFVTEGGGLTSHTAVIARSLGIPAVVGAMGVMEKVETGDLVLVDAQTGLVVINPDPDLIQETLERITIQGQRFQEIMGRAQESALTLDGERIVVEANVDLPDEIPMLESSGAEGVGLYRTEFLYLDRSDLPDEEEHYQAYLRLVRRSRGEVTVRTLDIGADKSLPQIPTLHAINPALGLRGLRLCLRFTELFRPQLRALMRVAAVAPDRVRVLLPMVTSLSEVLRVREMMQEEARALSEARIAHHPNPPLGVMIETPAALAIADLFAPHVEFFSIGTNDLVQYTLAVDRDDEHVAPLYDPEHPAILRGILQLVAVGERFGVDVGICGELAGMERFTELLVGLGLRRLSMAPRSIPYIKDLVRSVDAASASRQLTDRIQALGGVAG